MHSESKLQKRNLGKVTNPHRIKEFWVILHRKLVRKIHFLQCVHPVSLMAQTKSVRFSLELYKCKPSGEYGWYGQWPKSYTTIYWSACFCCSLSAAPGNCFQIGVLGLFKYFCWTNGSACLRCNLVIVLWSITVACYILNHSCGKMKRYRRIIFCLRFMWGHIVALCNRSCTLWKNLCLHVLSHILW